MHLIRTEMREFLKRKKCGDILTNVTTKGNRIIFEYGGRYYGGEKDNFLEATFHRAYFERFKGVYTYKFEIRLFPNEKLRDATEEEIKLLEDGCDEN